MRRLVLSLSFLCGAVLADAASDWKSLSEELEASRKGYVEKYQAFKPRFVAFAREHTGTEEALRAKLWLLQQCWWLRKEGSMSEQAGVLADEILKEYPRSALLGRMVEYHYVFSGGQRQKYFHALLASSPHEEVKAAALFGLARPDLRAKDEQKRAAARKRLRTLVDDYADVPWRATTYGAIASAYLDPHAAEDLENGKMAPEIEGIDRHGRPLKLSDFRGKVVLLDFWGDW